MLKDLFREFSEANTYPHLGLAAVMLVLILGAFIPAFGLLSAVWTAWLTINVAFYMREISNYQCQNFDERLKHQPFKPALKPTNWTYHDQAQTYVVWLFTSFVVLLSVLTA